MKKLKCIKCGIRYKERTTYLDPADEFHHDLCWNCGFIWHCIGTMLKSFDSPYSSVKAFRNRIVSIRLEDISIKKKNGSNR